MITINEAAKSHEYNKEKNSISSIINKSTISSFKAGVEFAQKWISIKEELPEMLPANILLRQPILVKYQNGNIDVRELTIPNDVVFWRYVDCK